MIRGWYLTLMFVICSLAIAAANATCSWRCWVQPCWGPGEDECLRCPHYRHNETRVCLVSCDEEPRLYADDSTTQKQCRRCHPQCLNNCTGPVTVTHSFLSTEPQAIGYQLVKQILYHVTWGVQTYHAPQTFPPKQTLFRTLVHLPELTISTRVRCKSCNNGKGARMYHKLYRT